MAENTEEFLGRARKRFAAAAEDEKELRERFISDLKFASPDGDDQWDPQLKQQRLQANRPAMSFPRCHTFVQQVSNEARQNKPQIKFAQSDSGDKETADIMEGLARYIQYSSDAQIAYETAIEYSAGGSFGYYRILTDYCEDEEEESDNQDIKVLPVLDPLTVYGILVPSIFGRKPMYWFVVEDIPKDEFKSRYPDSEISSLSWSEAEKIGEGWVGSEHVRVAEYWYVEEERVKGKRKPQITIKFCKTNGMEILPGDDGESSETVWPGTKCNIIPVLGKQMIIEGKPRVASVVRPQKGAQQLINYSKSRIAETLSQAPVSPFMAVAGQIDGYEAQWKSINTNPEAVLIYNAVDIAGKPAGAPQRQVYEPPIQSLSAFVAQEIDDMKATTGIYDASLGAKSNETSGEAILKRQEQSNMTTMHFMDNLERSFKQAGNVIGELIPKIYDGSRVVQILGADEAPKIVTINKKHQDVSGKEKHFDLAGTKGKWIVTMGKAYSSKRAESFDTMSQVIQTSPNLLPMVGDIMFKNSDLAGADQLAERFQKMLPPNLQEDQNNPLPPQAQAAVAQAQQQVHLLQGELQKLMFEKQAKVAESQGKMQQIQLQHQADMALEDKKLQTQIAVAEIQTKAQIVTEREQMLGKLESQFHDQAHDVAKQKLEHSHEKEMAKTQAIHDAMAADQQARHQSALADQTAANTSAQSAQDAAQAQEAQPAD